MSNTCLYVFVDTRWYPDKYQHLSSSPKQANADGRALTLVCRDTITYEVRSSPLTGRHFDPSGSTQYL